MKKRLVSLALSLAMGFFMLPVFARGADDSKIVILHTNDVHCAMDGAIGYDGVAALKAERQSLYGENRVALVDAGDAVQGKPVGALSEGLYPVELMNAAGYDLAVPGNHEFDYGVERFLELRGESDFSWLSCNFADLATEKTVLAPYKVMDMDGVKVGFVGVSTPESLSKADPTFFTDENGKDRYGFRQGGDGQELYDCVQRAVNGARNEGARFIVAIGHLGDNGIAPAWTSKAVIAHTSGIDVFIDGHSHEQYQREAPDKTGKPVPLTQAGTALAAVGEIVIDPQSGAVETGLITEAASKDPAVTAKMDEISAALEQKLNAVVGSASAPLVTNDPETGTYIVRHRETNLGDFCADAYKSAMGADIAFVNGGNIRTAIPAGEVTYGDIIELHPFGNGLCLAEVTGQQVLDALELGASKYPQDSGGFLQVAGLTYTIDGAVPSAVVTDEKQAFVRVDGPYRVTGVQIGGAPLDKQAKYTLASHNYMLKSGGDGYAMFRDAKLLKDETVLDNQALITYLSDTLGGDLSAYANPYGQGRITIAEGTAAQPEKPAAQPEEKPAQARTYTVKSGDTLWSIARETLGGGVKWPAIYALNRDQVRDPRYIYPGTVLRLPAA